MPKNDGTKRDGRATRIPAEPEAAQIASLFNDKATPPGQRRIITSILRYLCEQTGVDINSYGRFEDFYRAAAYCIGAANPRCSLREAFKLMAEGEAFADYKEGDHISLWKEKRRARTCSMTKRIAAELAGRLTDPKTPSDYRSALLRSLSAFCEATRAEYDEQDPARSYTEASGESEGYPYTSDEWRGHSDARSNIIDLLEGLRKRRAFERIELRAVRGVAAQNTRGREGGQGDDAAALRARIERLKENDDDDAILDCTRLFKLEKELYDLEHPTPEPSDAWDEYIPG